MPSQLTSEQLDELAPLLASLARLVARGSTLGGNELRTVLAGSDLDHVTGAPLELERWGKLLLALRQDHTEAMRLATAEALLQRGLLEAPVLLAVDTVARGGPVPTSSQPIDHRGELKLNVTSLDLGLLAGGQIGSAILEVQGGPGRVVVESDQVEVVPAQFGAGATTLQVRVKPVSGGMLWTSLKLVTAGQTLDVPVMAKWPDLQLTSGLGGLSVMPSPKDHAGNPAVVFAVALDGSGDFRSLEEAVQRAPADATITLSAGSHRLTRPLSISKPLSLVGAGMDRTQVNCSAEGYTVKYNGGGVFRARDLAFAHDGSRWARVFEADGGEIDLSGCRFSGGLVDATLKNGGTGLWLHGTVTGRVHGCTAIGNAGRGIWLSELARVNLDGNICKANNTYGIWYSGSSAGTARNNSCIENEQCGIWVAEQARPTLESNTCRANRLDAIIYSGSSAGTARSNICSNNGRNGIAVVEQSQPTLEGNTCQDNKHSGIAYSGVAAGIARNNSCNENDKSGIHVALTARPRLEGNRCVGNRLKDVDDQRR